MESVSAMSEADDAGTFLTFTKEFKVGKMIVEELRGAGFDRADIRAAVEGRLLKLQRMREEATEEESSDPVYQFRMKLRMEFNTMLRNYPDIHIADFIIQLDRDDDEESSLVLESELENFRN